tara:strand:+ start:1809 stop:2708 length:900 start_codon:yes stop_codon:yes gene_type:complete
LDKRLNIALVGFGKFGKKYYKNILKNEKLKLIAIFRKKKIYNNNFKKISSKNIDENKIKSAVIATPIKTHYKIAKLFIDKKIPIILEKPSANKKNEIKDLIKLSNKKRVSVLVNHSDLYNHNLNFLMSKINLIGKIKYIEAYFGKYSTQYKDRLQPPLNDWLPHPLAIIIKFFNRIDNMKVISNDISKNGKSYFQKTYIKFKTIKKIEGKIFFSNVTRKKMRNFIIHGKKGFINYDGYKNENNFIFTKKKIFPKKKYLSPMENILQRLHILSSKKKLDFSDLKLSLEIEKSLSMIRNKS